MNFYRVMKPAILISIGGLTYSLIEVAFRGYTHPAMFLVGGLAFYLVGLLNQSLLEWNMSLITQAFAAGLVITAIEFLSGVVLNLWLGLHIWDYSDLPFNLMGQICLRFGLIWVLLGGVAIVLDDLLRWKLFGEDKPRYKLLY